MCPQLQTILSYCHFVGGSRSNLSSPASLPSAQDVKLSGWTLSDQNFDSPNAVDTDMMIPEGGSGIYIVSFVTKVNKVVNSYKAAILINGTMVVQGRMSLQSASLKPETTTLSMALNLRAFDILTYQVIGDGVGMQVVSASRSLLKIQRLKGDNITEGISGYKTNDSQLSSGLNALTGFNYDGSRGTFIAKTLTALAKESIVVLQSGVFRIMAAIIVQNNVAERR